MEILPDNNFKAVCSVTAMARQVGLSRARFCQLRKKGVFPEPVYLGEPKRPFYPLDLQQKCIEIRRTGISYNGQPIIFYTLREKKCKGQVNQSDCKYEELASTLSKMGLNVALKKVKNAVKILYPEGLTQQPLEGSVIGDMFRYFKEVRQNGV
jgi:hypothetical protein